MVLSWATFASAMDSHDRARAWYLHDTGRTLEARRIVVAALEADPHDPFAHHLYQELSCPSGECAALEALYRTLHGDEPEVVTWRVALAEVIAHGDVVQRTRSAEVVALLDPLPEEPQARHFALFALSLVHALPPGNDRHREILAEMSEQEGLGGIGARLRFTHKVREEGVGSGVLRDLAREVRARPWNLPLARIFWRPGIEGRSLERGRAKALDMADDALRSDDPVVVAGAYQVFDAAGMDEERLRAWTRIRELDPGARGPSWPGGWAREVRRGPTPGNEADAAEELARLDALAPLFPQDGEGRAELELARAEDLDILGRMDEAAEATERAWVALDDPSHRTAALIAHHHVWVTQREPEKLERALEMVDEALAGVDRRLDGHPSTGADRYAGWRDGVHWHRAILLADRARLLDALDRGGEAGDALRRSVTLWDDPRHHTSLGSHYIETGEVDLAFEHTSRAAALLWLDGKDAEVQIWRLESLLADSGVWAPGGVRSHVLSVAQALDTGDATGAATPLPDLAWLAGTWLQGSGENTVEEHWMWPRGTSMIGSARHVADGKTVGFEHLRIEVEDGKLVYIALPSGQTETRFEQTELTETTMTFTNTTHDFPNRITYRLEDDDLLVVEVSGGTGDEEQAFELRMRRADH